MPNQQKANDNKLGLKNKVALGVNSFDGNHTGYVANGTENFIEMLLIEDLDRDLDLTLIVTRDDRPRVADTGLYIGDGVRDTGKHARAVFRCGQELDGLDLLFVALCPFNVHDPLLVDHELRHVLAAFVMHNYPFIERDIADVRCDPGLNHEPQDNSHPKNLMRIQSIKKIAKP